MKKAIITGVTGQDGAYLSEFLLKKGYEVHGIKRRSSLFNTERIEHLYLDPHIENRNFMLHYGDLSDSTNIIRLVQDIQPDEIYNLGAMSHVHVSFETPEYTANVDATGTLRILEALRIAGLEKKTRFYQASTSELYGKVQEIPQTEKTAFYPRSPYAVAKLYADWITVNYREAYQMYACNGILFNHESPIRGETFVTRKISRAVAKIALGMQDTLYLGNLSAKRDWGHAKDFVKAMYLMLQQEEADDYVIATGITTEVREFVRLAFEEVGISIHFQGKGIEEVGRIESINTDVISSFTQNKKSKSSITDQLKPGDVVVKVDPKYFRPTEVELLIGDPTKAKAKLGWIPEYDLTKLVKEMVQADVKLMQKEHYLHEGGYDIHQYFE